MHRRSVQQHRYGGRLRWRGYAAVIRPRQVVEAEFGFIADFPEEIRVEFAREPLCLRQHFTGARARKAQQYAARLDLQALAGRSLDLQRRIVIGEDDAGLQLAVVLEQDIHGGCRNSGRKEGDHAPEALAIAGTNRIIGGRIARLPAILHIRRSVTHFRTPRMDYVQLGASGLMVSPLCLGTMMFGDRTDAADSKRIIDAAFEAGVNFIDTADVYSKGGSERIVGPAISAQRRHWILATKVAQRDEPRPRTTADCRGAGFSPPATTASPASPPTTSTSITCIATFPDAPLAETVDALGALIRAGKIRYFGLSNFRGWRIAEIVHECEMQGVPAPVVCQPYYNLLNRMPEVEILPACDYYGLGVASYSPIARGVLTGKYLPGAPCPRARAAPVATAA